MAHSAGTRPSRRDAASSPFPSPQIPLPAFFTRQTNLTTHHPSCPSGRSRPRFARHHRLFRLHLSAADSDLFRNRRIDRRLSPADIRDLLDFMRRDGRASTSMQGLGRRRLCPLEEAGWWAAVVEAYIEDSSQRTAS
ncbi:ESCRT-II complex subunit domain-containing protein [Hirsutella rhossiliensis]|uniref:ESCRT-II complex subunit domain-containing protein n=1 Tax=Hirsutella rhossiliensis TaxID=111463 RepID=A0A9P8MYY8_9HYPO|nr:ESCRT-II complex subunit domain-containing protein [Hirsutella rhossiliensis]KAH0961677.1 ESCRT-II complex subunit domain-containing protein [Hirsutella rhossiliensis]